MARKETAGDHVHDAVAIGLWRLDHIQRQRRAEFASVDHLAPPRNRGFVRREAGRRNPRNQYEPPEHPASLEAEKGEDHGRILQPGKGPGNHSIRSSRSLFFAVVIVEPARTDQPALGRAHQPLATVGIVTAFPHRIIRHHQHHQIDQARVA